MLPNSFKQCIYMSAGTESVNVFLKIPNPTQQKTSKKT